MDTTGGTGPCVPHPDIIAPIQRRGSKHANIFISTMWEGMMDDNTRQAARMVLDPSDYPGVGTVLQQMHDNGFDVPRFRRQLASLLRRNPHEQPRRQVNLLQDSTAMPQQAGSGFLSISGYYSAMPHGAMAAALAAVRALLPLVDPHELYCTQVLGFTRHQEDQLPEVQLQCFPEFMAAEDNWLKGYRLVPWVLATIASQGRISLCQRAMIITVENQMQLASHCSSECAEEVARFVDECFNKWPTEEQALADRRAQLLQMLPVM